MEKEIKEFIKNNCDNCKKHAKKEYILHVK